MLPWISSEFMGAFWGESLAAEGAFVELDPLVKGVVHSRLTGTAESEVGDAVTVESATNLVVNREWTLLKAQSVVGFENALSAHSVIASFIHSLGQGSEQRLANLIAKAEQLFVGSKCAAASDPFQTFYELQAECNSLVNSFPLQAEKGDFDPMLDFLEEIRTQIVNQWYLMAVSGGQVPLDREVGRGIRIDDLPMRFPRAIDLIVEECRVQASLESPTALIAGKASSRKLTFEPDGHSVLSLFTSTNGQKGPEELCKRFGFVFSRNREKGYQGHELLFRIYLQLDFIAQVSFAPGCETHAATVLIDGDCIWTANLGQVQVIVGSLSGETATRSLSYCPNHQGVVHAFTAQSCKERSPTPSLGFVEQASGDRIILVGGSEVWSRVTPEELLSYVRKREGMDDQQLTDRFMEEFGISEEVPLLIHVG